MVNRIMRCGDLPLGLGFIGNICLFRVSKEHFACQFYSQGANEKGLPRGYVHSQQDPGSSISFQLMQSSGSFWHVTLAGVRSEKTMPESWMCFRPFTRSTAKPLTTSSDKHSSWEMTASKDPPEMDTLGSESSGSHHISEPSLSHAIFHQVFSFHFIDGISGVSQYDENDFGWRNTPWQSFGSFHLNSTKYW